MNEERKVALNSPASCRLIVGSPGVGKTYFGCQIADYEIRTRRTIRHPYQKVLFLTFARNAVARIREIYFSQNDPATPSRGSMSSDHSTLRIRIETFAGFCWWLVDSYGRYSPGGSLLRPWLLGQGRIGGEPIPEGHSGYTFDEIHDQARIILNTPVIRDLISDLYPLVIIDEHQDVDDRLHELITLLGKSSHLVLLRGPGQCIYGGLKNFHPDAIYHKTLSDLRPQAFEIQAQGPHQQRYCNEIADFLTQYNAGCACQYDNHKIRLKLIGRQTRNNFPNELETHAAIMVRDIRNHLRSINPGKHPSIAVLASTNNGVADLFSRLITGRDAYRLSPMRANLSVDDSLLLQYGRLVLHLLTGHWIAYNRKFPKSEETAVFLASLFHNTSGDRRNAPTVWLALAKELVRTVSGQKRPGRRESVIEKLDDDLDKINRHLRAPRTKLPVGSPPTPFTAADKPLLHQLATFVIHSIEPFIHIRPFLKLDEARRHFESLMQQRILFEKLGLRRGIEVMTIHKAKGREFDGTILVFEDNPKALWKATSRTSNEELVDLYRVAVSRARDVLGVVAYNDAVASAKPAVQHLLSPSNP